MSALKKLYLPEYTYDEYVNWEGRWELIYGVPYSMAPSPSMYHQRLSGTITSQWLSALNKCDACSVYETIDWKISEETVVQPDVLVVCKPFEEGLYLSKTPAVIFEILSPSTSKKDLTVKFEIYEKQGVKYYVIIDPSTKKATLYELNNGVYSSVGEFTSKLFDFDLNPCQVSFDFGRIW